MRRFLATALVFLAGSAVADDGTLGIAVPPPDYAKPVFVDALGCTYVRATVGDWVVWVQQLDGDRPVCDGLPGVARPKLEVLAERAL